MIDMTLDLVYDFFDSLFRGGHFEAADKALQEIRVEIYNCDVLIGILTATAPAKSKLPSRTKFYDDVVKLIEDLGYSEELLGGLK